MHQVAPRSRLDYPTSHSIENRLDRSSPFYRQAKSIGDDPLLNQKAIKVLNHALSLSPGIPFCARHLRKKLGWTSNQWQYTLKKLKDAGYLDIEMRRYPWLEQPYQPFYNFREVPDPAKRAEAEEAYQAMQEKRRKRTGYPHEKSMDPPMKKPCVIDKNNNNKNNPKPFQGKGFESSLLVEAPPVPATPQVEVVPPAPLPPPSTPEVVEVVSQTRLIPVRTAKAAARAYRRDADPRSTPGLLALTGRDVSRLSRDAETSARAGGRASKHLRGFLRQDPRFHLLASVVGGPVTVDDGTVRAYYKRRFRGQLADADLHRLQLMASYLRSRPGAFDDDELREKCLEYWRAMTMGGVAGFLAQWSRGKGTVQQFEYLFRRVAALLGPKYVEVPSQDDDAECPPPARTPWEVERGTALYAATFRAVVEDWCGYALDQERRDDVDEVVEAGDLSP